MSEAETPEEHDRPGAVRRAPLPGWWWRRSLASRRRIAATVAAVLVWLIALGIGSWLATPLDGAERALAQVPAGRLALWDRLAECESGGTWDLDTGNGFYGGLQFALESWEGVGGAGLPSEASRAEQIYRAERLLALQGWEAWPECSLQLQLG